MSQSTRSLAVTAVLLFVFVAFTSNAFGQVVISQVYGAGGNAGPPAATYRNDFIELHNNGVSAVDLSTWSVHYAATTGTSWSRTNLTGTIQPGQYYLIQASGGTNGVVLPTPEVISTNISMAAGAGKVALMPNQLNIASGTSKPAGYADFVGYGTGTNAFEGAVGPTATISTVLAAFRKNGGCTDTDNNSADFQTAVPAPRNTASSIFSCGPTNPSGIGNANPASALAGVAVLFTVTVTGGTSPDSTGLGVTGNFSSIGGAVSQAFFNDGTYGDATANDNVFSFTQTVGAGISQGSKPIPTTITDTQGRSGSATIAFTVLAASTNPTGTGNAAPSTLMAGENTLLTVTVTPGANPASTGVAVTGNLSSIGGSNPQAFNDNGTNGDITVGDGVYSYQQTIPGANAPGAKSLAISITDAQSRSGSTSIALTVTPPPAPHTIKISQVYGGGGNSGATYTRDFIEIFNNGGADIDITNFSVQQLSATGTGTWNMAPLCASGTTCVLQPGHYWLMYGVAGAGGTTVLPSSDAPVSVLSLGAASGKVALVNNQTPIIGACPTSVGIADLVGYASTCSETAPADGLSNTTAAVRRGNGCTDTDNNSNDFVEIGPIPRNNSLAQNLCPGVDLTQPAGVGIASPSSLEATGSTLLAIDVTPATTPLSTGVTVKADLTPIGGAANESFFEDATHGDETAGDNRFSLRHEIAKGTSTGAKNIIGIIRDEEGREVTAPITLSIISPTCGVERWSVKVGTDADNGQVVLNPVKTTIAELIAIPPPGGGDAGIPTNGRVVPTETTVWTVNAKMTIYKKEGDVDYHIVLEDEEGHTLIAEIPSPACIITSGTPRVEAFSPFAEGIDSARAAFDAKYLASPFFNSANVPVQVTGAGFFDFIHGQSGVAGNGIELHPVIAISFTQPTTTTLASTLNPAQYGQAIGLTATVAKAEEGPVPTGIVKFFDGAALLGSASVSGAGEATLTTSALNVGTHTIRAHYEGDATSGTSTSNDVAQQVTKADQSIDFAALGDKTFGDADFTLHATASSGGGVSFALVSGPATVTGSTVHITGGGSVTIRASQGGDDSYNPAPEVERAFTVNPAAAAITVHGYSGVYDGSSHGATGSSTGIHGEDLSGLRNLGASFTNAPGGTANWSFAGNANYAAASGSVNIVITKATPLLSGLSSPVIMVGATPTSLAGTISLGALVPTGSVSVTLHGVTQNAAIQGGGSFSSSFATGALPAVNPPYTITYAYAGDTNFNAVSGTGTLSLNYGIQALYDQTKAAKSGSVIPIKLQLTDATGGNVSSAAVVVTAIQIVRVSDSAGSAVEDAGSANPDNNFRYSGGMYIFNLSTKGLATGTYNLAFTVQGDSASHTISFQVN